MPGTRRRRSSSPSRFVAADLAAAGVDEGRITVVPSGADHLPRARRRRHGRAVRPPRDPWRVPAHRRHARATQEPGPARARLRRGAGEPLPGALAPGRGRADRVGPPAAVTADTEGVVFAGAVPDAVLAELYRARARFRLRPADRGRGLPPLEAMRAGTPAVVANEVPSVHDLGATGTATGAAGRPARRRRHRGRPRVRAHR